MVKTETLILKHLLDDESFTRRTLPYLKPDYFSDRTEKLVYQAIDKFVNKYNNLPTREALIIEIDSENSISDEDFSNCKNVISDLVIESEENKEWLVETTEKFCQEKALYLAIMNSIAIIDGKEKNEI